MTVDWDEESWNEEPEEEEGYDGPLNPLSDVMQSPSAFDSLSNYAGETEFPGWLVVLGRNRDSDDLANSNFECALEQLGGEEPGKVEVFNFGHWACGWIEYLCVHESARDQVTKGEEIQNLLTEYPILDEEDFSRREQEHADQIWRECYSPQERLAYIRENRSQFEFSGWTDLLSCVRGRFFCGYPSELLS